MMFNVELIKEQGELHAEDLKRKLVQNRQVASGRTLSMIKTHVFNFGYSIRAPRYLHTLQWGRQPSQSGSKGSKELYNRILQWVSDRGIVIQDGIKKSKYTIEERTAKTITYFIHKRGTRLYYTGYTYEGVNDPLGDVFSRERIDKIKKVIADDAKMYIKNQIFKSMTAW